MTETHSLPYDPSVITTIDIEAIRKPVAADLEVLDTYLRNGLSSEVPLIAEIGTHILRAGGKRLRPLLVLLVSKACGYAGDLEHCELALVIEFIHMATLLHDDVIDQPDRRRGQKTANTLWGNAVSVLVGDFLYSRAFQILTKRNNVSVMQVLANATNQIAEGEVRQLINQNDPNIVEADYYEVIRRKTAQLFSAATEVATIISGMSNQIRQKMADFGHHLGMAYQVIDDLLDYNPDALTKGKGIGNDLTEGKMTLPLIFARQVANPKDIACIDQAIYHKSSHQLNEIITIIDRTEAKDRAFAVAKQHISQAQRQLSELPNSSSQEALHALTNFVIHREY